VVRVEGVHGRRSILGGERQYMYIWERRWASRRKCLRVPSGLKQKGCLLSARWVICWVMLSIMARRACRGHWSAAGEMPHTQECVPFPTLFMKSFIEHQRRKNLRFPQAPDPRRPNLSLRALTRLFPPRQSPEMRNIVIRVLAKKSTDAAGVEILIQK